MVSTSSRVSVTLAMLEVHATLIRMIAVLLLVITAVVDLNVQIEVGGGGGSSGLHWIRHGGLLNYKLTLSFCCTQQCTYNLRKVFSSDF